MNAEQSAQFETALNAYHAGQTGQARELLMRLLAADDHIAEAWLLLSYIEANYHDQRQCAENALAVAPDSEDAQLRAQQLRDMRLPDNFASGRAYSVIPPVQEARDAVMSRYSEAGHLETVHDPLDDPMQCPYCGVVNPPARRVCSDCGQSMMRPLPPGSRSGGPLSLVFALHVGVIGLVLLQLMPVLLWAWYVQLQDGTRVKYALDIIFEQRAAWLVLADFTETLTPLLFMVLIGGAVARAVLHIAAHLGMRVRSSWGYYLGLTSFVVELVWAFISMALGWTGLILAGFAALIAVAGLGVLAAASSQFWLAGERYRVVKDGKLKSAIPLMERGMAYQRHGMWAMAVAQYRAAVAAAPDRAEHQKLLGIGYNKLGRPERALPILEQALRLDPTDMEVAALVKRLRQQTAKAPPPVNARTSTGSRKTSR